MATLLISGVVSLVLCLCALPAVKRLAAHFRLYDPVGPLKIHSAPVARLGGIAMMLGFLTATAILPSFVGLPRQVLPVIVFAAVWLVGLADDLRPLGATLRFTVHVGAGAALWYGGWRLGWTSYPAADLILTCLFVAFVINAMNLLDGMDGLAAGTAAVISVGFLAISLAESADFGSVAACSLLGACLGMLAVNAPPATMFMGDSGSTLLGIVLAFLSLNWIRTEPLQHSILIPLLLLSVPLADACFAILRRARGRSSLFDGDRRHYYDILLQRGLTTREVLGISLAVNAVLAAAAWLSFHGAIEALVAAALVSIGLLSSAYLLGSMRPEEARVSTDQQTPVGPAVD